MAVVASEYAAIFTADTRGFDKGVSQARDELGRFVKGTDGASKSLGTLGTGFGSAGRSLDGFGRAFSTVSRLVLGASGFAAIVKIGQEIINAGSSFETAFAGVRKTVQATEPELAVMRQAFRDMASEIPVTANELAKIGEAAGALGVDKEHIVSFARTMADLGVTTNLTSDQAATGLARVANIMKNEAGPQFDRLGATLVALGNAGASTEAEILEMSLRIAGAGKVAGLSEADVLGFANALSSVGIEAEAGGTAISRVFLKIDDSVKLGGKNLQIFAKVAGQSAGDFKRAFQDDAAGATVSFIEGLGKISASGKSLTPILKDLELNEIRVRDALLRASGAGDLFRDSLELGSEAWRENSALTREAAERYKTFDSQIQIVKNKLFDIGVTIFEVLRPKLTAIIGDFDKWLKLLQSGEWGKAVDQMFGNIGNGFAKLQEQMNQGMESHVAQQKAFGLVIESIWHTTWTNIGENWARDWAGIKALLKSEWEDLIYTMSHVLGPGMAEQAREAGRKSVSEFKVGLEMKSPSAFEKIMTAIMANLPVIVEKGTPGFAKATGDVGKAGVEEFSKYEKAFIEMPHKFMEGAVKPMKKAADQMRKNMKEVMAEMLEDVNAFANRYGTSVKVTAELWGKFDVEVRRRLHSAATAHEFLTDKVNEMVAGIQVGFDKAIAKYEEFKKHVLASVQPILQLDHALNTVSTTLSQQLIPAFHGVSETLLNDSPMEAYTKGMERIDKATQETHDNLTATFEDLSRSLPDSWNLIIDGILNASGRTVAGMKKLGIEIKGWANDIIGVIGTLPGKFGDAARGVLRTIDQWVLFADKILAVLNRINSSIPASIGGIFEKIAGIFKGSSQSTAVWAPIEDALDKVFGKATKSASSAGAIAGKSFGSQFATAATGIMAGVGAFMATRGQGLATGVIGGAMAGASTGAAIGSLFGPGPGTAIGMGIGAAVGAIAGLFGAGKSELEKAQEAAQLQQAKDAVKLSQQSVLKAVEETKQSMLSTINQAREILESIRFHTKIGKEPIKAFFKDLTLFMKLLLKEAERWKSAAHSDIKAAAEHIGAAVQLVAAVPAAFTAIFQHLKVPDIQFDAFFADFDTLIQRLGIQAEATSKKTEKQIKKFSERIAPAVDIVSGIVGSLKDMDKLKAAPDAAFDIIESAINTIVTRMIRLGESFDKGLVKAVEFFSAKMEPVMSLWTTAVAAVNDMFEVKPIDMKSFDILFAGMDTAIMGIIKLAEKYSKEGLPWAHHFATTSIAVFSAIGSAVENLSALRDYKGIAEETIDTLVKDFQRGIDLIRLLMIDAVFFLDLAKEFEDTITKASDHFAKGLQAFTQALTGGMTHVNGVLNKIGGGIERGSVFPSGGGFTGASFAPSPRGNNSSSTSIGSINVILPPGAANLNEEKLAELVAVQVSQQMDRRDRKNKQLNYQYV